MKIYGIDFTSDPHSSKPITCTVGELKKSNLEIQRFELYKKFEGFEKLLESDGPFVAGMDFPFGQPRKLIMNIGWPTDWEGYVRHVSEMSKPLFVAKLRQYQCNRPPGDVRHFRVTDTLAGSCSPMQLDYTPVARMFFEGAQRLSKSPASILPCRPRIDSRIVIEAYPALVARSFIGTRSYKTESPANDVQERRNARKEITSEIQSNKLRRAYRISIGLSDDLAKSMVADYKGDLLDSVLCAIQAAWSYQRREENFGIPKNCNKDEGWIVDPSVQSASS